MHCGCLKKCDNLLLVQSQTMHHAVIIPQRFSCCTRVAFEAYLYTDNHLTGEVSHWHKPPCLTLLLALQMGGIVLHEGMIAEMQTGEGKTLVATLPVYLSALLGNGIHMVTVNDYLAKRDAEWCDMNAF